MSSPKHLEAETRFYFITTNIINRKPLFSDGKLGETIIESLYFLRNRGRLGLHGFAVMPDHLHCIISLPERENLPKIMHSLKSFTAKEINKKLGCSGKIWQDGYYSHGIRNEQDALTKLGYIFENPVRKGIVEYPEEYYLCSAHHRWEIDPIL